MRKAVERFGTGSTRRVAVASRLERIDRLARSTGLVARLIVFESFVTAKPEPNDVDVFLLMDDSFEFARLEGETRLVFDHAVADAHFGASVFWMRRMAAFGGEQAAIEFWQTRRFTARNCRNFPRRGVTMVQNDCELQVTTDRLAYLQAQVAHLWRTETNPANYRASVTGFLAEIDRMQLEVREYLSVLAIGN